MERNRQEKRGGKKRDKERMQHTLEQHRMYEERKKPVVRAAHECRSYQNQEGTN